VTLSGAELATSYVTGSDAAPMPFEQLQSEPGERRCLTVYRSGGGMEFPDLRSDVRFARFLPRVLDDKPAAVFPFPLHHCRVRVAS
jgi:hypothetical protein